MILAFLRAVPLTGYVVLGVAGFIGLREWQHAREAGRLEKALLEQSQQISTLQRTVAEVQLGAERMDSAVKQQNTDIRAIQAKAKQIETTTHLVAARTLQQFREESAMHRPMVPPGHIGMNDWRDALQKRIEQ